MYDCCSLFVVRCVVGCLMIVLFVDCGLFLESEVCCLWFAVRCAMSFVCWLVFGGSLSVVCCLLFAVMSVVCLQLFDVWCCLQFAVWCVLFVAWCM